MVRFKEWDSESLNAAGQFEVRLMLIECGCFETEICSVDDV